MRKPLIYEKYLHDEIKRYGWENSADNELPSWLIHEINVYNWIFRLSRTLNKPIYNRTVSNNLIIRLKNIRNNSNKRYENISSELQGAVDAVSNELGKLYEDLTHDASLWTREHLLSKAGIHRWKQSVVVVDDCLAVIPNPDWREQWEKSIVSPYCTRREAEIIAIEFAKKIKGLDLYEIDPKCGKAVYYHNNMAKNGIFKMCYGCFVRDGGLPMRELGVIVVDMLNLRVSEELI